MMGWDMGWGWMFSGGLMMVFFWGGLLVLVVLVVRALSGDRYSRSPDDHSAPVRKALPQTPLEVLQTRYAKGEISREEYETIRHDLQTS